MKLNSKGVAAFAGATMLGIAAFAGGTAAYADPSGAPTYRDLAGVGSDTTDNVMNALSDAVKVGGTKVIASYNATGSANIQTKSTGCTMARPNGSGAGKTALLNSLNAADNCLQFARSSSGPSGTSSPSLTYVPFATDAVTFAVRADGDVPKTLSQADLQAVYKCQVTDIHPVLPQTGSGTRSFWLGKMGITEAQITGGTYPCLTGAGTTVSPAYVQEHDGRSLKTNQVMPYSVAQYQSQATSVISDIRGKTTLGILDDKVPTVLNTASPFSRQVYNIIPTSKVGTAPWSTVFVGGSSLICQQTETIHLYGFNTATSCGDTSQLG